MKKKYKCEIDCAACAAKVEEAIKKVPGVKDASVNFLTQKMTIESDDEEGFDELVKAAVRAGKKAEADFEVELV